MAAETTCGAESFEAALHDALTESLQALAKSSTEASVVADTFRVVLQEAHRRLHIVHKRCILQLQTELEQARQEIATLQLQAAKAGASDVVTFPTDIPAALHIMLNHFEWQHLPVSQLSGSFWCIGGLEVILQIARPPEPYVEDSDEEEEQWEQKQSAIGAALSRIVSFASPSQSPRSPRKSVSVATFTPPPAGGSERSERSLRSSARKSAFKAQILLQGTLPFVILASLDDGKTWESLSGLIRFFGLDESSSVKGMVAVTTPKSSRNSWAELQDADASSRHSACSKGADSTVDIDEGIVARQYDFRESSDSRLTRESSVSVRPHRIIAWKV